MTNDKSTTIQSLKDQVQQFCDQRDWGRFHNPKDLAIGISTEANELLQILRFKANDEIAALMQTDRKSEIEDELADVLYFVLRFAQMNNIDLSSSLTRKICKNDIKYPVAKAKGCNKKYNEYK